MYMLFKFSIEVLFDLIRVPLQFFLNKIISTSSKVEKFYLSQKINFNSLNQNEVLVIVHHYGLRGLESIKKTRFGKSKVGVKSIFCQMEKYNIKIICFVENPDLAYLSSLKKNINMSNL